MLARRLVVVLIALLVVMWLGTMLWHILAPGGWTVAKLLMFLAFAGTAPWTGLCAANGVIGFSILCLGRETEPMPPFAGPIPPTAIALAIRNEDLATILPALGGLMDELTEAGVGDAFTPFVLSDTRDPTLAAAEESAIAGFPGPIRYRRRLTNTGFKAGNIMDFLDHHADGFELMLTLDADSNMSADGVLRLIRTIQSEPQLAIVQHLTVGQPAQSAFPRLFQFGMRAGMRVWATGQAWWQGDEGPYWGHNAIVRIAPFRAHCRLPSLSNGHSILSHDQVEAALLAGAGWGVRVLTEEDGSSEVNPPALPELLHRELRWLAGNFQYVHLLGLPGLRPMGRWQLLQAILLFTGAPFYLLLLAAAVLAAITDTTSPFPIAAIVPLITAWLGALYAPKLLGYAEVALSPEKRSRYGGLGRFAWGAVCEFSFSLLLDAISAVAKTIAMARLAFGAQAAWPAQNRQRRDVGWGEAVLLLWPQTVLGVVAFIGFAVAGWPAVLCAIPLAGGLLLAIPLCVITADRRIDRWLRRKGIAAVPEELTGQAARPRTRPATVSTLALRAEAEPD